MATRFRQITEARRQRVVRSADYLEAEVDIPRDIRIEARIEDLDALYAMVYAEVDEFVVPLLTQVTSPYLHAYEANATILTVPLQTEALSFYQPTYAPTPVELTVPLTTESETLYSMAYEQPDLLTVPLLTETETEYQPTYFEWTINFNQVPGAPLSVDGTLYSVSYTAQPTVLSFAAVLNNPGTLNAPDYIPASTGAPEDLILNTELGDLPGIDFSGAKGYTEVTTNFAEITGSTTPATDAGSSTYEEFQFNYIGETTPALGEEDVNPTITVVTF